MFDWKKNKPLLFAAAAFIIYACFQSKMHFSDGLMYSYVLENYPIRYDWHPHHPLWLPLMKILYDLTRLAIPGLRAIAFLSFVNAVLGGITVFFLIRIVDRITNQITVSVLAGVFFALSWGMLTYCRDANIYVLVFALLLIAAFILMRGDTLNTSDAYLATGIIIFASFMHQLAFLFTSAALVMIIIRSSSETRIKTAVRCISIYTVLVMAVNYIVYLIAKPLVEIEMETSFVQWLTSYGATAHWWTMFHEGFLKAEELFCHAQLNAFLYTTGSALTFHTRMFKTLEFSALATILHLFIIGSVIYEIVDLVRSKSQELTLRQARILMIIWFLPYFIFNQFYCSYEPHYKIFFIIPLLCLWSFRIAGSRFMTKKIGIVILSVFVFSFAIWNGVAGMVPSSIESNNPYLVEARDIGTVVKQGDLVIMSVTQFYLSAMTRYYTDADSSSFRMEIGKFANVETGFMDIDSETVEFLNSRYDRIFLTDEAFNSAPRLWYFAAYYFPPPHPPLLGLHPKSVEKIGEIKTDNGITLHKVQLKPVIRFRDESSLDQIIN